MPTGLQPTAAPDRDSLPSDPQGVVEAFLAALADGDTGTAAALVDDDILYVNVGLPSVRGREEMGRVFALLDNPAADFEVYIHSISADDTTVLTERTDVIGMGRLRAQFWVWGRFDVSDGRIVLWRDSFDFVDIVRATVRGALALVLPGLAAVPPGAPDDPPGR